LSLKAKSVAEWQLGFGMTSWPQLNPRADISETGSFQSKSHDFRRKLALMASGPSRQVMVNSSLAAIRHQKKVLIRMNEELCYEADRFRVVRITPPDSMGLPSKEVIRHPGAVVMIPVIDEERLCLIRNFRLSVNQTLVELPAGTCQPGEEPLKTAQRELLEETGYLATEWRCLGQLWMSPGILDEKMYVYEARQLTQGQQQLEVDERIETTELTWREAEAHIVSGAINDAKTIAALSLWKLQAEP
jgi:ADP-ribose pyrophosphatase